MSIFEPETAPDPAPAAAQGLRTLSGVLRRRGNDAPRWRAAAFGSLARLLQPGWRLAAVRLLDVQRDRKIQRGLDRADGPWQPQDWPGTEVGWGIRRASWGRGYAPEAAVAAIDWAFDTLGWHEVIHTIAENNDNSRAVARKLGSRLLRMGELPPPYNDKPMQIWGQSREQWRQRAR